MSGIYIPNMEIPNPGHIVLVEMDENGDVFAAYDGGRTKLTQHKAVPVPPHGRLIDADALKTMWDNENARLLEKGIEYLDYHVDTLFSDFKHDVDKMPTIIPAEEEK